MNSSTPTGAAESPISLKNSVSANPLGDPLNRLAVALDFPSAQPALDFVDRLDGSCRWLKVRIVLFCAAGTPLLEAVRKRGCQIFLDLKLHDIPTTVAGAVRSVAHSGASLLTI